MQIVSWLWDMLVWDPVEEIDALEMTLAELRRGSGYQESLAYASRLADAQAAHQPSLSPVARFARRLRAMSRGELPRDREPEPWRTMRSAWETFGDSKAMADNGFSLIAKLRNRRALGVELARRSVGAVLTLSILAAGSAAIGLWEARYVPIATTCFDPATGHLAGDCRTTFGLTAAGLALSFLCLASHLLRRHSHVIPGVVGGTEPELLFFVSTGLAAGVGLPAVLARAAEGCPSAGVQDRRFLTALAASIESHGASPEAPARPTRRLIAHAARQWQLGVLTTEGFRFSALVSADRNREGFQHVIGASLLVESLIAILPVPFIIAGILGGPVWHFVVHYVRGTAMLERLFH